MSQVIVFCVLGLSSGAVYGSLGLALVISHRSSGVVNFAIAAVALVAAYMYAFLRQGRLMILLPGAPSTVSVGSQWGFWPAAIIALLCAAALSLLMYAAVIRPLRNSPATTKAVATLAVLVFLTGLVLVRVGTTPITASAIFPTSPITIGGVRIPQDRIWFAVTVIAVSSALGALYRYTRFGLRTRAVAETEKGATVSGIRADRVAAVNWMLSGAVAGLAGVLIAPVVPLAPGSYTIFIVPALAAAILARFRLAWAAVLAGIGIGVVQSELELEQSLHSWLPQTGLTDLVPLLVILVVLLASTKPLPSRGVAVQQTLGRAPLPRSLSLSTCSGVAIAVVAILLLHGPYRSGLLFSLVFALIGLSSVVITGYAGQVSLAQLTMAGAGGFLLSPITETWHVPFPLAPLIAALGSSLIGVIVGLPALRIRGLPVAVVTLGLAVALESFWFENSNFVGVAGENVAGPTLSGLDLRATEGTHSARLAFCLLVVVVLALTALGIAWLRRSRLGSSMLALRSNERAAAASGINVVRTKVLAFAIASFIAGIGGTMLAYQQQNITYGSFDAILGLTVFAFFYLGGITSISGVLVGAMMVPNGLAASALDQWINLGSWETVLGGLSLTVTILTHPEGIVGPVHQLLARRRVGGRAVAPALDSAEDVIGELDEIGLYRTEDGVSVVLGLRDVTVQYGSVTAVSHVDLDVRSGEIVGLIGPNGAGKTTLLDAISGFVPSTGSIELGGHSLAGASPHKRAAAGLGRTFQALELWDDLTVAENIEVGLAATKRDGVRTADRVKATLELLGLASLAEVGVAELSQGHRQLVSISRALIGRPKLLLLDEPAAGLDSSESAWLARRLRAIRQSGVTILLIDHDMGFVFDLCERVHVLDLGSEIAAGAPADVQADPAVIEAYLGSTHAVGREVDS